jgi:hypothetical protein
MALVAVVERAGDREGELPTTRIIPVGMPQDTDSESYFGLSPKICYEQRSSLVENFVSCCTMSPESYERRSLKEDSALSLPTFLRQRRSSRKSSKHTPAVSAPPVVVVENYSDVALDRMFELSGSLEADGGLPGDDMDTRIAHTLAALVAFLDYENHVREMGFAAHTKRMTEFLRAHKTHTMLPERTALLDKMLMDIEQKRIPENAYQELLKFLDVDLDIYLLWVHLLKVV